MPPSLGDEQEIIGRPRPPCCSERSSGRSGSSSGSRSVLAHRCGPRRSAPGSQVRSQVRRTGRHGFRPVSATAPSPSTTTMASCAGSRTSLVSRPSTSGLVVDGHHGDVVCAELVQPFLGCVRMLGVGQEDHGAATAAPQPACQLGGAGRPTPCPAQQSQTPSSAGALGCRPPPGTGADQRAPDQRGESRSQAASNGKGRGGGRRAHAGSRRRPGSRATGHAGQQAAALRW